MIQVAIDPEPELQLGGQLLCMEQNLDVMIYMLWKI